MTLPKLKVFKPLELTGEWRRECRKRFGEVLTGRHCHYCPDWDHMPMDETLPEFELCGCIPECHRGKPQ